MQLQLGECERQTDSTSCGVRVIELYRRRCLGQSLSNPMDVIGLRREFETMIRQKANTTEKPYQHSVESAQHPTISAQTDIPAISVPLVPGSMRLVKLPFVATKHRRENTNTARSLARDTYFVFVDNFDNYLVGAHDPHHRYNLCFRYGFARHIRSHLHEAPFPQLSDILNT